MDKDFYPGTKMKLVFHVVGALDGEFTVLRVENDNVIFKSDLRGTELPIPVAEIIWSLERGYSEFVLDDFTSGYLECALFAENDNSDPETGGDPLDRNYGIEDFAPEALQTAIRDCLDFQQAQAELLQQAYDGGYADMRAKGNGNYSVQQMAGHDFWFTRNGHGVGFWDRGLGEVGDKLSEACKPYGSENVEVGDGDKKLYFL